MTIKVEAVRAEPAQARAEAEAAQGNCFVCPPKLLNMHGSLCNDEVIASRLF